jgi:hypothetical protein
MQTMQQVTYAAKGLAGLLAGWALGHGLMWGAVILGALVGQATSDVADRSLLGGMLLAICLLAVLLVATGLAELRRVPAWLTSFLLGMATAPVLTLFGFFFFTWEGLLVD